MNQEKAQEVVSKIEKTTLGEICEYIEEIHTKMHSFLGTRVLCDQNFMRTLKY